MKNPFTDWKDEQQCTFKRAMDASGRPVGSLSPEAFKWCAMGWLDLHLNGCSSDYDAYAEFHMWCLESGLSISRANDDGEKTQYFRDRWDQFVIERHPEWIPQPEEVPSVEEPVLV